MRRLVCLAAVVLLGVLFALTPRITLGAAPFTKARRFASLWVFRLVAALITRRAFFRGT